MTYEARHRRLLARLTIVIQTTIAVDLVGSVAIYFLERHARGTEVKTFGDALFFTTVQLLTVSSQLKNPLTTRGRMLYVVLELWAVIVVAGGGAAMAEVFRSGASAS